MTILYFFDLFGTFAFAVSGAILGIKKDMDIYGMFILAVSVGVGGGTMRDVLLSRTPPFVLTDINYMIVIAAATLIVFFLNSKVVKEMRYIGWDVCFSNKGPILVEGNEYPGHDIYQLPEHTHDHYGIWPKFTKAFKK